MSKQDDATKAKEVMEGDNYNSLIKEFDALGDPIETIPPPQFKVRTAGQSKISSASKAP